MNCPRGVYVSNGEVFFSDSDNHCIRKMLRSGQVVTIAGGNPTSANNTIDGIPATEAKLNTPAGVFVSSSDEVFICEYQGHRIRKIRCDGTITTIAGNGTSGFSGDGGLAIHAMISFPWGVFVSDCGEVYIADRQNMRIRKIDRNGIITTIAGNETSHEKDNVPATQSGLNIPFRAIVMNDQIYIAELSGCRVRKVDSHGIITTIAGLGVFGHNGDNMLATSASLHPSDIDVTESGEIYICDRANHRIRKIDHNGIITTIAGIGMEGCTGDGGLATEAKVECLNLSVTDGEIYFTSAQHNCIRKIDCNGIISTIIGTGERGYAGDVPYDFKKYPHIGRKSRKPFSNRDGFFVKAYQDVNFNFSENWF